MEDVGKELKRIISKRNYQEKYAEMIAEVLNDADVQAFLSAHQEELTQADIEKSYAKLYEFVQEKRKYQKNDPTMIAPGYEPDQQLLALALQSGAKIFLTHDPKIAADGANYIYADVWASMGQESEQKKREEAFKGFCVDSELMSLAAPGVKFLHCLPAHRGEEVTDEVMESEASIVWDEAENRLHAQKAILEWVFSD